MRVLKRESIVFLEAEFRAGSHSYRTVNVNGQNIDYFEVTVEPFSRQIFPGLGNASFVGYNGISPGATYWVQRYQQTVVRVHNTIGNNVSTHLHGSDSM